MIRLWSAEAPFEWPNSNCSRPSTRAPGCVDAQYAAPEPSAPSPTTIRSHSFRSAVIGSDGRWRRSGPPARCVHGSVRTTVCYVVRMNVRTNLMLPEELVKDIDHFAGPRGRSRYVAEALAAKVKRDHLREAIAATAGIWTAEDYPEFATPEMVVEWVRARRSEVTDPGMEDMDATDAGHDVRDRPPARRSGSRGDIRAVRRGG